MLKGRCWKTGVLMSAAVLFPAQSEPPEADILVIARKMRTVRLNYTVVGRHLKTCEPVVSSGDTRIDRIMCAVLRQCTASGKTEVAAARACMNDRIAMLEEVPLAQAAATGEEQAKTATPTPKPVVPLPPVDELVVTAQRLPVLAGQWHFSQSMIVTGLEQGAIMAQPTSWRICIPDNALLKTFAAMLSEPGDLRQPTFCHDWKVAIEQGQVNGKMRCMLPGLRLTGTLKGMVSATKISVLKEQRQKVIDTKIRVKDGFYRSPDELEKTIRIEGKRIGDCPRS